MIAIIIGSFSVGLSVINIIGILQSKDAVAIRDLFGTTALFLICAAICFK